MATHTLDFERPLLELERQIEELKRVAAESAVDVVKETVALERKLAELREEIYGSLTPMQRVQVARHPKRPYTLDYLRSVFTDFVELHGDRLYRDDRAQPARDGGAQDAHRHGGDRRGRLGRGAGRGARRPGHHARKLRLLGDLPRGVRRDPLEGRQPAGTRRPGARGVPAPPPPPAPQDQDREAPQAPRREVPLHGCAEREVS